VQRRRDASSAARAQRGVTGTLVIVIVIVLAITGVIMTASGGCGTSNGNERCS
jgi:hypothetical protein